LTTAVAFIWNLFLGLLDLVLGIVNYWYNIFGAFVNFFGNLFNDPIGSIINLFGDLADNVLGVIESIAKAMDKVFGSNMADTVAGWREGLSSKVEIATKQYGNGSYEEIMGELNLSSESLGMERWAYSDAFDTGAAWGDGISDKLSGLFSAGDSLGGGGAETYSGGYEDLVADALKGIEGNTAATADAVDISNENLKYLRDSAEIEAINKFTTAEIKLDMTNNNNIASNVDIDGIVTQLSEGLREAMESAAEGVYA
jgi:hypothetical protein